MDLGNGHMRPVYLPPLRTSMQAGEWIELTAQDGGIVGFMHLRYMVEQPEHVLRALRGLVASLEKAAPSLDNT